MCVHYSVWLCAPRHLRSHTPRSVDSAESLDLEEDFGLDVVLM